MPLWPPRGRRLCLFVGRWLRPCSSTTRKVGNGALLVFFHDAQGWQRRFACVFPRRARWRLRLCFSWHASPEKCSLGKTASRRLTDAPEGARRSPLSPTSCSGLSPPPALHFPPRFGIIEVLSPRGQPCLARAHAAAGFPRLDFGGALWTRSRFTRSMLRRRSSP